MDKNIRWLNDCLDCTLVISYFDLVLTALADILFAVSLAHEHASINHNVVSNFSILDFVQDVRGPVENWSFRTCVGHSSNTRKINCY